MSADNAWITLFCSIDASYFIQWFCLSTWPIRGGTSDSEPHLGNDGLWITIKTKVTGGDGPGVQATDDRVLGLVQTWLWFWVFLLHIEPNKLIFAEKKSLYGRWLYLKDLPLILITLFKWPEVISQDQDKARLELLLKLLMNQVFICGKTFPLIEYITRRKRTFRETGPNDGLRLVSNW